MGMKQQEEYDGDGAATVSSTQKMVFAYYVTGHGFDHTTRVAEVVRQLILAGHDVHVVAAAPEFVFTNEVHSPCLFFRKLVLECGAVQSDALTVDPLATLDRFIQSSGTDILNQGQDAKYVKFLILALSLVLEFHKAKERAVEYSNKARTNVANAFSGIVDVYVKNR
ncbi:hypothetical protein AHAS_Ahas07G0133800 [Arachis hypogaea]